MITLNEKENTLILQLRGVIDQETIRNVEEAIIKANNPNTIFDAEIFGKPEKVKEAPPIDRIILDINSPGGFVFYGMSLVDTILTSRIPVDAVVHQACSMASIITVACRKRYAYPHTIIMFHDISSGTEGTLENMQHEIAQSKKEREMIDKWTCSRTNINPKTLASFVKKQKNWYMSVEDAITNGVIHEVIPYNN